MNSVARSALFYGKGLPLSRAETTLPTLRDGEVLVRVVCTSLCRSDLHTFCGNRTEPTPTILGHEIVGDIVSHLGELPDGLTIGSRVTWGIAAFCGSCFFCERGLTQKCSALFKYGHMCVTPDEPLSGGLATHVLLRKGTPIFAVPAALSDEIASIANCSTSTAVAAVRVGEVRGGDVAVVFGAGILGLTAIAILNSLGCPSLVVDPSPTARERVMGFGATAAFPDPMSLSTALHEMTQGRGADAVFELSGFRSSAEASVELARIGGTIVWAGTASPVGDVPIAPEKIVRRMLNLRGLHNYGPSDLEGALAFLEAHHTRYPFAELFGASFPLDRVNEAFRAANESGGKRITIRP